MISEVDPTHRELIGCLQCNAEMPVVQRCHHASSIIDHELEKRKQLGSFWCLAFWYRDLRRMGPVPLYGEDADGFAEQVGQYVAQFSGASASGWLAFGDVLATLRETDRLVPGQDRPLPPLRAYQLRGDSSTDRIRAALELAERELASERNPQQHPETVVTCVAQGIEALAKRLWQEEFPTGRNAQRGLVAVLDQKKHSKNQLEQRFAGLALSLYTVYRRPALHEPDDFRCTWGEARFFVSGIRVLLDLSDVLVQRRNG